MYDLGVPISIVIDDYLPMNLNGTSLFDHVDSSQELWPLLVEKAFSKLNGNYWSLTSGFPMDAGYQLMGVAGDYYSLASKTSA